FVLWSDDTVWHKAQTSMNGSDWTDWEQLGNPASTYLTGLPVLEVGQNHDGRLEVFLTSSGINVWHIAQTSTSGAAWSDWSRLGGAADQKLVRSVIQNQDGKLELFANRLSDDSVSYTSQIVPDGPAG